MRWGWVVGAVVVGGGLAVLLIPEIESARFALSLPLAGRPFAGFLLASARKWAPDHVTPAKFAALLAGIIDHESRFGDVLTPKGPRGTGDHGNGLGLGQIDRNQHPVWAATAAWWDPAVNIDKAAEVLAGKLRRFPTNVAAAVASYTASDARVASAVKAGKDPQSVTTRGAYVDEVAARLALIQGRATA
jgi:hypothetical protein